MITCHEKKIKSGMTFCLMKATRIDTSIGTEEVPKVESIAVSLEDKIRKIKIVSLNLTCVEI